MVTIQCTLHCLLSSLSTRHFSSVELWNQISRRQEPSGLWNLKSVFIFKVACTAKVPYFCVCWCYICNPYDLPNWSQGSHRGREKEREQRALSRAIFPICCLLKTSLPSLHEGYNTAEIHLVLLWHWHVESHITGTSVPLLHRGVGSSFRYPLLIFSVLFLKAFTSSVAIFKGWEER